MVHHVAHPGHHHQPLPALGVCTASLALQVQSLISGGADFIFNGQPAFAVNESQQVRERKEERGHWLPLGSIDCERLRHPVPLQEPCGAAPTSGPLQVDTAQRINVHGFTANDEVFTRDLKGVFGVSQSNTRFTSEIFTQYRATNIFSVS